MPSKCEILFDTNVDRVVFSGQVLTGRVVLTFDREEYVKSIVLVLYGKGMCKWSRQARRRRKHYNGEESYLCSQIYLMGSANSEEQLVQPGIYTHTFEEALPEGLPSSVTSDHGNIEYKTSVTIYRPEASDQSFGQTFTVVKPFDLTSDPVLREVVNKKKKFRFSPVFCGCCCLCCCESEPLFLEARIPATGYTPRQTISLLLIATNTSSQDIPEFKVELFRIITWREHANGRKTKTDRKILWDVRTDGCVRDEKQEYRIDVPVPATPSTDDSVTKICSIEYLLKIEGAVGCWHIIPSLEFPIVIGTSDINDYIAAAAAGNLSRPLEATGAAAIANINPKSGPNPQRTMPAPQHVPVACNLTAMPSPNANTSSQTTTDGDPPTYEEAIKSV